MESRARSLVDSLLQEDGFPVAQAYGAARVAQDAAKTTAGAKKKKKKHGKGVLRGKVPSRLKKFLSRE